MKNPLAVFTGAALATVAALAGLNMTNGPGGSIFVDKTPEVSAQPQPEGAGEASKTPEKPAEIAALPAPEAPKAETQPAPEPPKAEAPVKPELDTVRVESDGQAVVAGRAKPGAEVSLKLGDQVLGKGLANADGSWVVVPDSPLPKGAHELTIEQKSPDSAPVMSEQSIAVAVPEQAGQQAMVALSKPGEATKVLQSGENQQQASAESGTAEPAAPEQPAVAEKPAGTEQQPAEAQPPVEGAVAGKAPEGEPAASEKTPATTEQAEQPPAAVAEAKPEDIEAKPAQAAPPKAEPAKIAKSVALRLDAVDYNDKGDIIFSGRAAPGTAIRLYVDNGSVGDAIADSAGNWTFAGSDIIKPGTHTLRADQIDKAGKVMARIELPFQREDAAAVAALNTPPVAEPPAAQLPQTTEVQKTPEAKPPQTAEVQAPETKSPDVEQPQTAEQPQTTEQPQTAEQPKTAEPPQTAEQPKTAEPPQTAQPQTAEVQPPQKTEVTKSEPEVSGPAPDQPVAASKKEEVAAAAEQAAQAIDPDKPRSGKVVIQPGNNLWKLSRIIYGRGKNYTVIYKANKDQIRNPNRIYPGQIFAVPNANPPESIDPKRKDPLTSAEGGAAQ